MDNIDCLLQWNAGAARRQPTQLVTAMCGAFNAVLLQEARDHVQHISDQFDVYTDGGDLAILLNRDTFLPGAVMFPIIEETTSKTTWGLKALVVCGYLRRPPVGGPKSVTLCTVHLHNVVAKTRDAATSLLQRLYAHMMLLGVELVGGDFNSAAKGIIAYIFSDPEFMAPGSVPLWGAGGLEGDDTDCTGFLYIPRRHFHWIIKKHGVHTFANKQLGLNERDESTHYPVFMHLWATHLPGGTRASLRSDAARARRALRATGKNERKRQRRLFQAAESKADPVTSTATAGKLQSAPLKRLRTASPTHPAYHRNFPITCCSMAQAVFHEARVTAHSAWIMCELTSESLSDTDEEVSYQNMFNVLLNIVTNYQKGATVESCMTDEELGRVGLSCHFAADCLCDNCNMFSELGDDQ